VTELGGRLLTTHPIVDHWHCTTRTALHTIDTCSIAKNTTKAVHRKHIIAIAIGDWWRRGARL